MIINETMGIILTSDDKIPPITDIRASSALPVAGGYRIIDFVLSNMAAAGIKNIGVVTKSNYSSLMDHIKSGKPWDLDRKDGGLHVLPPSLENTSYGSIRGNIDMLAGIREYIHRSHQTYVVLSLGNKLYNTDFSAAINHHIQNQSDITVVYKDMTSAPESELSRYTLIETDKENRIENMEVKPRYPKSTKAALDVFIMEKALLESIIDECSARGDTDFVKDAIIKKMSGLRIHAYEHLGAVCNIDTMESYYKANMCFLDYETRQEFLYGDSKIYTKSKDLSPTKYGDEAVIQNSLVSDGCVIDGTVINSILARGVKIEKGAVVKNSIIMQDSVIENDVELDHVVSDKDVLITKGRKLVGQETYPIAVSKGNVI